MLQDQRSVLELLYKISREFASALDLKTVLTRVLFAAINNVGGERASIVVLDDNGRVVESAIVYGNKVRESTTNQIKDTVDRGLAGWVVRNRQAALVPDTSAIARQRSSRIRAWIPAGCGAKTMPRTAPAQNRPCLCRCSRVRNWSGC